MPTHAALATLATHLRTATYRDTAARAYFGTYVADYHVWLAAQGVEVQTDSDAIVALVGAIVSNPEVRRAFVAAQPTISRLVGVLDAAERSGHQLRPPAGTPRQHEDGSVSLEGAPAQPPAPPPPPPAAAPAAAASSSTAASSSSTEAAPPKAPTTPAEALEEGRQAHDAGELLTDGPYPSGELGDAWETGWKRAKHDARDRRRHAAAPAAAQPPADKKKKPSRPAADAPPAG